MSTVKLLAATREIWSRSSSRRRLVPTSSADTARGATPEAGRCRSTSSTSAPIAAATLMDLPAEAWETLAFTALPTLQRLTLAFEVPQAWQRREEVERRVADRRRLSYITLHAWVVLAVRFLLAAQMFYYGMAKVIPTQFPRPSLITLVEPAGHIAVKGLFWTATGASWTGVTVTLTVAVALPPWPSLMVRLKLSVVPLVAV